MERHRTGMSDWRRSCRTEFRHFPGTTWDDPRFERHADFALFANPHINLTSRGCIIRAGNMLDLANEYLKAAHLEGKKQLGLLTEPVVRPGFKPKYFDYTRADHVNIAATLMDLAARNIGANLDERAPLRLAENLHDHFTSPMGDMLKLLDRETFDEDANPKQMKAFYGWRKLRDRYHFNEKLFWEALLGKGWASVLHDLADKASYLALDASSYILHCEGMPPEVRPAGYYAVKDLIVRYPAVCDVWKMVKLVQGQIVLLDAELFGAFLMLRALMFNLLYYNPAARVEEHFVGSLVLPYFYRRGEIVQDEIFPMSDAELEKRIGELIAIPNLHSVLWNKFRPQVYALRSLEGAQGERNALLIRDPNRTILIEEWRGVSSSGTHYLVKKGERILAFRKACPKKAAEIENLMQVQEPFRLYSFDIDFQKYPKLVPIVREYNEQFNG